MLKYITRRLLLSVLVLWSLATVTFVLVHLIPGNPVALALQGRVPVATVDRITREAGLYRPLLAQYVSYFNMLLHGNLGNSISLSRSVEYLVGQRIVPSLELISYGLLIAIVVGVPLAIISALQANKAVDHGTRLFTTFLFGMPTFWLGLMIALLFGLKLNWFPVSGYENGIAGGFKTLTLPALTLGLSLVVLVTRSLRFNLIQVLNSEYIEAARSRGISEWRILFKHSMRNAVMPTFTILSAVIGFLIGGTVVLEQVFQIPGLGSLLVNAVLADDYSLVQALALVAGALVVTVSLLTDLLQVALDPRVRLSR
jgi:ABC-type dipeptide/oligopeptide/nickel transport system permease component